MKARGLVWLGTRTRNSDATVRFFGDTLGLHAVHEEPDFAVFRLPNGDKVEVFGPGDEEHEHFAKGPVADFLVDDVREARGSRSGRDRLHRSRSRGRRRRIMVPLQRTRRQRLRGHHASETRLEG
jgi:catechol 2,3-dioxygenase-like lactoylglutathione lyase family enzyme